MKSVGHSGTKIRFFIFSILVISWQSLSVRGRWRNWFYDEVVWWRNLLNLLTEEAWLESVISCRNEMLKTKTILKTNRRLLLLLQEQKQREELHHNHNHLNWNLFPDKIKSKVLRRYLQFSHLVLILTYFTINQFNFDSLNSFCYIEPSVPDEVTHFTGLGHFALPDFAICLYLLAASSPSSEYHQQNRTQPLCDLYSIIFYIHSFTVSGDYY